MYIVFDIGGTKTRLASSHDGETLTKTTVFETPKTYEDGLIEFKKVAHALSDGDSIEAIAGGIAGLYDQKKSMLIGSPNLSSWVNRSLRSDLETFFNAPVFIENDAAVAGLGEAHQGAGKGSSIVAYITVSTGIGGARIVDGKIDRKAFGFEPGHQIIDADKTMIPGSIGNTIEKYISGKGLSTRTGQKPKEIKEAVFWDGFAKILAYGLNNVCVFWSPDVIVLGGSMIMGDPAIPLGTTEKYLREIVKIYPELPRIRKSEIGDLCGLYGSLEFIKQQLER